MPLIIRLRVAASTMSATLTDLADAGHVATMEWIVEFEGQRLPMDRVWSDEFAQIVGPLVAKLKAALNGADGIDGLKIVIYAEDDGEDMSWGFKFEGQPLAVNRAVDLLGPQASLTSTQH